MKGRHWPRFHLSDTAPAPPLRWTSWQLVLRKSDCPDRQRAVMPAEAEAVGDGVADPGLARFVGHVVQVAVRIRRVVVDGRMDDAVLEGQRRGDQLHAAGSA